MNSEISDLQSEIEQLSSGATSHGEWQQVEELESQISSLKDERKELQNAEEITDFDSELVADVAQADLEAQREEAEQIESIYAELEEKGLDVETPSNSAGADMASLQQDLDTSSSEIDAEEVDAILGNNAESSSEGGQQSQHETLRKILEEIKSTRNALETLRLRVDMDLNSREFNKIMDNRAEAVVEEQIG
ncbi:hypothetical protein EL22_28190 [Halostagnicola sp. A56]|uniref:hypothetical protein n=1 Tax=Halostagnicola sp. A56 TaxID=1495067 RepID=UPI00065F6A5D|nr:hypothetical protein [Halostagnicola sp. A56]KMT45649.1 hypothetical protein EL22_28190 [Halostagnicola sp. A56]